MNILKNAVDEFSRKNNYLQRLIFINTYEKNDNLYIEIKDNAGGIPENIIDKIFDSYFTTKDNVGGTGIGLSMSKQIIEQSMHGSIKAYNEEFVYKNENYKGAVFEIIIPKNIVNSTL